MRVLLFFLFKDPATTEIYTLSLHDALPISAPSRSASCPPCSTTCGSSRPAGPCRRPRPTSCPSRCGTCRRSRDRKSTRLNSSHVRISYAVFCLKKKKKKTIRKQHHNNQKAY